VLDKYLDASGQLDYQKLWADMGAIEGFLKDKRREALHKEVIDAYRSKEQLDNTPTRDQPNTDKEQMGVPQSKMVANGQLPTEIEVVQSVNKQSNRNFRITDDEFCTFDAQDDDYIVEVKVRKQWYPDCLIQYDKYDANNREAERSGKESLYIVATITDIYVFNITKLRNKHYKFRWDWKVLPKNTDFGGDEQKITKFVGFIDTTEASVHYKD
jgi:hypothetical protein